MSQTRQERRMVEKNKMHKKESIISKNEGFSYTFLGKVLPERVNVSIPPLTLNIDYPDAEIKGIILLSIQLCQIYARFTSKKKVENILTLRNHVDTAIRIPVDNLGYLLGCGYDIEIDSMIDFSGKHTVFSVGINDNVDEFRKNRPREFPELLNLSSGQNGKYLQYCLSDLREAILQNKGAGFFCYRAIESLSLYFADSNGLPKENKKEIWEKFRDSLDINREKIDFILKFSKPVRHGDTIYISSDNMKKIFDYTYEIIDKYVIFASNGYKKSL